MATLQRSINEAPFDRGLLRRFNRGVFWNLISIGFNQGSTFFSNIIVANLLGRQRFGEYAIVLSTIQSLSGLAGLGMGYTATRYLAEFRTSNKERAGRVLGLCSSGAGLTGGVVALALFVLANTVATGTLHAPHLATLLQLGAIIVFFTALTGYFTGVLAGFEAYRVLGIAGIVTGSEYLVVCAAMAWYWGITGAVVGLVVSAAFQCVILSVLTRKIVRAEGLAISYRDLGKERPLVLRWILPGIISGLTAVPALWGAQVVLARQAQGYAELALYSAAYSLTALVLFLPNIANNVGMSLINNMRGKGDALSYRRVFWINLQFTVTIEVIGALGIALCGRYLLHAYGDSYMVGLPVLLVLLAATIPESLTFALNQVLQSNEKIWLAIFVVNLPRDTTILLLAYMLAPRYGALGLAIAYFCGRAIALGSVAISVWRIGLGIQAQRLSEPELASVT